MDLKTHELNPEKIEGQWFRYDGSEFKIAYFDRPNFTRIAQKIGKRYTKEGREVDPALQKVMTIEIMAEAVLVDWRGVKNNGVEIEPTKANKITALGHQPFRDWVSQRSQEFENYAMEAEAEDVEALKSSDPVAP
jgi:hypothetical protein